MRVPVPTKVAVLADTHGTLSASVVAAIQEIDPSLIVHAGDVGGQHILLELEAIAPVVAVRGNTDHGPWADELRESRLMTLGGYRVAVVHDAAGFRVPPDVDVVISGHTHIPLISPRGTVLHINPGSVSRPRTQERVPTIVSLEVTNPPAARIVSVVA